MPDAGLLVLIETLQQSGQDTEKATESPRHTAVHQVSTLGGRKSRYTATHRRL